MTDVAQGSSEAAPLPPSPPPIVRAAPASVPSTRSLRMLFTILKHNPTATVQEVGVVLMLHLFNRTSKGNHCRRKCLWQRRRWQQEERKSRSARAIKEREEVAKLNRRTCEAEDLLAIATLTSEERHHRRDGKKAVSGGGSTASALPAAGAKKQTRKKTKTRFVHQLRQPVKVEDRLRAWAATRGREVAALRELLGLSEARKGKRLAAVVQPSPAYARLVRERVALISAEKVDKVRAPVWRCCGCKRKE